MPKSTPDSAAASTPRQCGIDGAEKMIKISTMKANELRIGNWVDVNGKFCKVESISHDGINYTDETDHYEDQSYNYILWCSIFDPIPLTHEILKKAGFVSFEDGWYGLTPFRKGYMWTWNIYDRHLQWNGNIVPCQYLHQLQNLYFALTGEELNIEL
jgi:hypothetical protein